jgi:hypothetical protein
MENDRLILNLKKLRRNEGQSGNPICEGGWAARGSFTSFGVNFGLLSDDAAAYRFLFECLPPGTECMTGKPEDRVYCLKSLADPDATTKTIFTLFLDQIPLIRSSDIEAVAASFENDVKCYIAGHAPRRVFLRAGVVGWRDRAIVLPGGPRSGKSTLVRALVRCGATCFSDEYAVLEGSTIHPYPPRLPIWTEPGLANRLWADESGDIGEPIPLPVGIVVFAPYQSGAVWKPKLLSRGKLLLGMFKQSVGSQANPDYVIRILEQVTKTCNALEGVRGDAHGVATFLLDRLV